MSTDLKNKPKIPQWALYTIMGGMLVFGTANTLILKVQDQTESPGAGYPFIHPYL
jgi:hypothetical protein